MPPNSHFHFDFLVSGETLRQIVPEELFTSVGWDSQRVYVKLVPGADPARMEASFPEFFNNNLDFWKSTTFKLFLQPLLPIHLESNLGLEMEANGSLVRIYTFSAVAIFILIIASDFDRRYSISRSNCARWSHSCNDNRLSRAARRPGKPG